MFNRGFLLKALLGSGFKSQNPALLSDPLASAQTGKKPAGAKVFSGVGIDSRQSLKGRVFFALKGEHFDGHDFLKQAQQKGAKAFVVSNSPKAQKQLKPTADIIPVPDTLQALTRLAKAWREKQQLKVIGITGSNGKTTTKNFTKTLLSQQIPQQELYASPKSYNNAIGLSLSILAVPKAQSLLVQEIGTSQPGEIAFLTQLCQPFISAVTMVGPSHLLGLKTLPAIAKEKQNIYLTKEPNIRVFNKDNHWTRKMWEQFSKSATKSFSFSAKEDSADVCLKWLTNSPPKKSKEPGTYFYRNLKGKIGNTKSQAEVPFADSQNLSNLMGAACIALAVGLEPQKIWEGLSQCRLPTGRQQWFYQNGLSLCFDAYNANPTSMGMFLDFMAQASRGDKRILVLGDMKELGDKAKHYHKQLAQHISLLASKAVFFIGEYTELIGQELQKKHFKGFFKGFKNYKKEDSLPLLKQQLKPGDVLGFKASRGLFLERFFEDLTGLPVFKS